MFAQLFSIQLTSGTLNSLQPLEILDNRTYWFDVNHLNEQGAKQLPDWLSIELSAVITNNKNANSY